MQVSVEATSGLERRMTVTVPAAQVEKEVENRLKQLSRTVRIAGFRPGKVPVKVVATRYGAQVRNEVIGEVTQSSFREAVTQENLRLAGMPQIEPKEIAPGSDLEYIATFEVFGDVELVPLNDREIEKPVATVTDDDVSAMVEKLRQQRANWVAVERPAQEGDKLNIDFEGTIDGAAFEGNAGQQVSLVLGSNSFIPGFEDGLIGSKPGDETTLDLQFPDDYRAQTVAGKPVQFKVKINEVAEPELPELDAEFMSSFEVSSNDMDGFLAEIRNSMESELDQVLRDMTKKQVLDMLYEANPVDVPEAVVQSSIDDMMAQMRSNLGDQGDRVNEMDRELFAPTARRKAALGILLNEIAKQQGFRAAPERVKERVEKLAETYDQPDQVVRWYYSDRSRLSNIESLVVEDMVVDWVIDNARVIEKNMTFDEVMQAQQA